MNTDSDDPPPTLSLGILVHPLRRAVLTSLQGSDEVSLEAIANDLAENEQQDLVKLDLHHTHLPKMDAAGLIEYDADTWTVQVNDALDAAVAAAYRHENAVDGITSDTKSPPD